MSIKISIIITFIILINLWLSPNLLLYQSCSALGKTRSVSGFPECEKRSCRMEAGITYNWNIAFSCGIRYTEHMLVS